MHALKVLASGLLLTLTVLPGHGRGRIPGAQQPEEKQQRPQITVPCALGKVSLNLDGLDGDVDRAIMVAGVAVDDANVQAELAKVEPLQFVDLCPAVLADFPQVEAPGAPEAEQEVEQEPGDSGNVLFFSTDDEHGWLGVTLAEVTAEKVKELKLPAERGVLITEVQPDSPAAKAGLKAGDVITELSGLRIEGAAQFRRLVGEIPPGRQVALTVWRDGKAQTLAATLTGLRTSRHAGKHFAYAWPGGEWNVPMPTMPAMPAMPAMPIMPRKFFAPSTPRLGIDAEDLSGDFGKYFGAPDGEGVLVREVGAGTPAEKGGIKAGDVIIRVGGERVKTTSDLRAGLRAKRESKMVEVVVIRKGAEMKLSVEVEPVPPREGRRIARRIAV
jgi:hypothetical protein